MAKKKGKSKQNKTPNQIAFQKEINRIKSFIRKAEERGYEFNNITLPTKPDRITKPYLKAIREEYTPDRLYEKARYIDTDTGEILTGTEARKLERSLASKKGHETRKQKQYTPSSPPKPWEDGFKIPESNETGFTPPYNPADSDATLYDRIVISSYVSSIRQFNPYAQSMLLDWLYRMIEENGLHNTAIMIDEGIRNGNVVTHKIVYVKGLIVEHITDMMEYLPEQGKLYKENILDAFIEYEDYHEL